MRPNVKFDIDKFGCSSVRTPVIVEVAPAPPCESGLLSFVNQHQLQQLCLEYKPPVEVKLRNFGLDTLTSVPIDWTINGLAQQQYIWTGNLAPKNKHNSNNR